MPKNTLLVSEAWTAGLHEHLPRSLVLCFPLSAKVDGGSHPSIRPSTSPVAPRPLGRPASPLCPLPSTLCPVRGHQDSSLVLEIALGAQASSLNSPHQPVGDLNPKLTEPLRLSLPFP